MPKVPGSLTADMEARLREAPTLPTVLKLIDEFHGRDLPMRYFLEALNALATRSAAAPTKSVEEDALRPALGTGERLLRCAAALNGGKPVESAVSSMVRLSCACGATERALELIGEAQVAGMAPKLRTLSVVLQCAAEAGDGPTCGRVWDHLPRLGLAPRDVEFAAMLRGLRGSPAEQPRILRQLLDCLPLPSEACLIEEIGRVFGVEHAADLRGSGAPPAEGREQGGRTWRVGWTSVDAQGVCSLSGRRLQAMDVTQAEEDALFACTLRLANDSGQNRSFHKFYRWIQEQPAYDVVVDGANVGFNNQNHEGGHFQYEQIQAVVQKLRDQGKRVLLVLHPKWLKENADLSVPPRKKRRKLPQIAEQGPPPRPDCDEEEADGSKDLSYPHDPITEAEREAQPGSYLHIIRTWKEMGVLLRVPVHDCDDWYWLVAALDSARKGAKHIQVVSNDHMRDHHWRMFSDKAFLKWRSRHMTRVSILAASPPSAEECHVVLSPPRPFSLQAQVSADGTAWHFPVPTGIPSRAEQLASGRPVGKREIETAEYQWLVAWQEQ